MTLGAVCGRDWRHWSRTGGQTTLAAWDAHSGCQPQHVVEPRDQAVVEDVEVWDRAGICINP